MYLELEDGSLVQGSEMEDVTFRSSLEPVPCSFEGVVRINPKIASMLLEGKIIKVGRNKTPMQIIYVSDDVGMFEQGGVMKYRQFIALHENSCSISYRLNKAVIRENLTLSEIYQACGGKSKIEKDFAVSRFYCYKGNIPSYEIAMIMQENGGVIHWIAEGNKVAFARINELFAQSPKSISVDGIDMTQRSSFLERHEVPSYISLGKDGGVIKGNFDTPRSIRFSPHKTEHELGLMTTVILNAKVIPVDFTPDINAGDIVEINNVKYIVVTAAHRRERTDGNMHDSSTFWLGVKG